MPVSLLVCEGVAKSFGGIRAVVDGTITVAPGTIACLIGPNGAGKTTFFNLVSGILEADAGTILFDGTRIEALSAFRRARLRLSRTFQDPRLFYEMTVENHVLAGIPQRGERLIPALLGGPASRADRRDARARADEILDRVGLRARAGEKADRLSFGEQRLLSIARSLGSDPKLLMLDEPTVGMDEDGIRRLEEILHRLVADTGVAVLMVEHNMSVVFRMAERLHLMLQGSVVASGDPATMRNDARLLEAYLGKRHAARG